MINASGAAATVSAMAEGSATDTTMSMDYGASLTDVAAFENSLARAASPAMAGDSLTEVARVVFEPLDFINREAGALAEYANAALESDNTLSPAEIVSLTVKSQEFMFHSQLTANIANRTADGIQQLFRQQS